MFEEVPCERHGLARLLPVRHVVLGPFVLGGGMLVAALGGSVAVAAAATMITASAIGSDNDLPARPGHVVPPSTSSEESVSARRSPVRLPARPVASQRFTTSPAAGVTTHNGVAGGGGGAGGAGIAGGPSMSSVASPSSAAGSGAAERTAAPYTAAGSPTPSASGPLGNAVIRVSGYDQASGRLVYQFATVRPRAGADGRDQYLVSDRQSFSAPLAPSVTITSGGGICPPAGSACTPDQVIRAAESGFFAVVAIDTAGVLRSITEVGGEPATVQLSPVPSINAQSDGSRSELADDSSPTPSASPTATP